jgi:hypothetical protein
MTRRGRVHKAPEEDLDSRKINGQACITAYRLWGSVLFLAKPLEICPKAGKSG